MRTAAKGVKNISLELGGNKENMKVKNKADPWLINLYFMWAIH
jgi:hypothetical protein